MQQISDHEKEQTANAAASFGLEYIDLAGFPVSSEALRAIPQETAEKENNLFIFPASRFVSALLLTEETKEIAAQIATSHDANVVTYLISEKSFQKVIKLYATLPVVKAVSKDIEITEAEMNKYSVSINNLDSLKDAFKNVNITDILTLMVSTAIKLNSSDMHVESEEGDCRTLSY